MTTTKTADTNDTNDTSDANDRFAKLREHLQINWQDADAFVSLIDFVNHWPFEEDRDIAIEYLVSHLVGQPSESTWIGLLKQWRDAFGKDQGWPKEGQERLQDPRLQSLSTALITALDKWPAEYRVFTRYRPGHPLWPITRTLRLMHLGSFKQEGHCQHIEHLVIRRNDVLTDPQFSIIETWSALRKVTMRLSGIASVTPLANLTQVTHMDLGRCYRIQDLDGFDMLHNLTHLNLHDCEKLVSLAAIARLPDLSWLNLSQCPALQVPPTQATMTTRQEVAAYQKQLLALSD